MTDRVNQTGKNVHYLETSGVDIKLKKVRPRKRVALTAHDKQDALAAGLSAAISFKNFLSGFEEIELFGFVLDGKTSDERSMGENESFSKLIQLLLGVATDRKPRLIAPKFEVAFFPTLGGLEALPIKSFTVRVDDDVIVYLSAEMGFRESLLASQGAYGDFTVIKAESFGLRVLDGDVAKQISHTVATGEFPDFDPLDFRPEVIEISINGNKLLGVPRH